MSDVKGLEISDLLGLSQPLTKLVETVSGGIDTLYKPWHLKRMAKAKAEEINLISAAIVNNSNLPINYQHGNVGIDSSDIQNLLLRTQQRLLQEEMKKQQNMDAVVARAAEELQTKEQVSEVPVDEDWAARFGNIAKDISSEEMQNIWGRILAGEVEKPGSFSIRTLDTIRNISRSEAVAFQKIVPLVMKCGKEVVISSRKEILNQHGVTYEDIMLLDECGLMASNTSLILNMRLRKGMKTNIRTESLIAIVEGTAVEEETVSIGIYSLSKAGRELYSILAHNSDDNYFHKVLDEMFSKNRTKVSIVTHKIAAIDADEVICDTNPVRVYKGVTDTVQ